MKGVLAGALVMGLLVAGCATGPDNSTAELPPNDAAIVATAEPQETLELDPLEKTETVELEKAPLGLVARRLGEVYGGGIVVMNGLNMYLPVGPISLVDQPLETAVNTIATAVDAEATRADGYFFVHAPGPVYEALNSFDLELNSRYNDLTAAVVFGVDTPLFNAFALLGHTLGVTIVADNSVAGALTGEVALSELPLSTALEALLKSSRTSGRIVAVECTDEYIFLRHIANEAPPSLLLGADHLAPEQVALLDRRVALSLPVPIESPEAVASVPGANALGYVLPALSKQLGVKVRVEPGIERVPVNPVVMNDVRVRTAMDLLLRQWVLPEFAYELTGDVIVIRHIGSQ